MPFLRKGVVGAVTAGAMVAGIALTGGIVGIGGTAYATPLPGDAQAQARVLADQVERLERDVARAAEHYNAVSTRLSSLVTESIQASARLDALTGQSNASHDEMSRRVSAIYRSGGGLSLYATVLDGSSPTDLMNRLYTVESLVIDDLGEARDLASEVRDADATKARLLDLTAERTALAAEAEDARDRVDGLLESRQAALDAATATVRELADQEAARRLAAAETAAATTLVDVGALMGDVPPGNPYAETAIAVARSKIGIPYVWGGTGPNGYDCSGLMQVAYGQAGLPIMRVAADQFRSGPVVPLEQIAPGDLVFWASTPGVASSIHHVAMYVGNGMMIEAPRTGLLVRLVPLRLGSEFMGPVRPGLGATGARSA